MNNIKYDIIVYIGQFQPPNRAHMEIITRALALGSYVIILIGSAGQPRTIKNPFSWDERAQMIRLSLTPEQRERTSYMYPLYDKTYNDAAWARQVQNKVSSLATNHFTLNAPKVGIIGHSKSERSHYLKMFPQWPLIDVENIDDVNTSRILDTFFTITDKHDFERSNLPRAVRDYLLAFMMRPEYEALVKEYEFIEHYKRSWATSPYPPVFMTVDAVVIQSGHILIVKRRARPGVGLWALPGGFIRQSETLEEAMLRELREETKLKVPAPVIKGSIKNVRVFDAPDRSLRGRTITQAYHIDLGAGPLPPVKGGDDASRAKWVPLSIFEKMEDQLFEDHFHIVQTLVGI